MFNVFLAITFNNLSCLSLDEDNSFKVVSVGDGVVLLVDKSDPKGLYPFPNIFWPVSDIKPEPPNKALRTSSRSLVFFITDEPNELNMPLLLSSFL